MILEESSANTVGSFYGKRIVRSLRVLMQFLDTHSRQLLKSRDVTIPQIMCLEALIEKGDMPVGTLATEIRLSPSTTVGIIDRLERKKMLKRMPNRLDRRSVQVSITPLGQEFYKASPHLVHNKLHETLQALEVDKTVVIADALETLVALLEKNVQQNDRAP